MEKNEKSVWDRKGFMVIVSILYFTFTIIFFLLWDKKMVAGKTEGALQIYWHWTWLATVVAYSLASISGTGLSERALKLLFGVLPVGGEIPPQRLTFAPLGFFTLSLVPIEIQEMELPGEPEQIWRFKDENQDELPLGIGRNGEVVPEPKKVIQEDGEQVLIILPWVQPVRVLFGNKDLGEDNDPLSETSKFPGMPKLKENNREGKQKDPAHERVTAEVVCVLQWRVREISDFFRTYGSFSNAKKMLADVAVAEMTAVLQAGTPARALGNQELLSHHILRKVRERVGHEVEFIQFKRDDAGNTVLQDSKPVIEKRYLGHPKGETLSCRRGIEIVLFQLKPPNFSHDYNKAIQAGPEALGKANADAFQGQGEKKRMEALKEVAGTAGGEMLLALERLKTVQATIGKNDKIVLIDSQNPVASLLGTVTVAKSLLEDKKQDKQPSTPSSKKKVK